MILYGSCPCNSDTSWHAILGPSTTNRNPKCSRSNFFPSYTLWFVNHFVCNQVNRGWVSVRQVNVHLHKVIRDILVTSRRQIWSVLVSWLWLGNVVKVIETSTRKCIPTFVHFVKVIGFITANSKRDKPDKWLCKTGLRHLNDISRHKARDKSSARFVIWRNLSLQ